MKKETLRLLLVKLRWVSGRMFQNPSLNNLQKDSDQKENIEPMIFSELRGEMSFNIQVDERLSCFKSLFHDGTYTPSSDDDESTINMHNRYQDIEDAFPDELKGELLPHFLDWRQE